MTFFGVDCSIESIWETLCPPPPIDFIEFPVFDLLNYTFWRPPTLLLLLFPPINLKMKYPVDCLKVYFGKGPYTPPNMPYILKFHLQWILLSDCSI